VSDLLGERRVYVLVGCAHLLQASTRRMQKIEEAFRQYGLQKIMLSHCAGVAEYSDFARTCPGCCRWPGADVASTSESKRDKPTLTRRVLPGGRVSDL